MPWILWSHHFCPLLFIIQAAKRIVVNGCSKVYVSEGALERLCLQEGGDGSGIAVNDGGGWMMSHQLTLSCLRFNAADTLLLLWATFLISQWRRLGQIFHTLLGDRIDSWHWLLDMTGCVPEHISGDKGNAKLVCFYPIGHLFFTAFPCLIF